VSPFGARGANSGVQDADNLGWKLALVASGNAPERLLDSYDAERTQAADENILASTRATDFITPKNAGARRLRDATLELARDHAFARRLVNSGRLSLPTHHAHSPLNTPDMDDFAGGPPPGSPALDAPDGKGWLLDRLKSGFTLLQFGGDGHARASVVPPRATLAWQRYDAKPGTVYLFRPDQHVCYRARRFDQAAIDAAISRATAQESAT